MAYVLLTAETDSPACSDPKLRAALVFFTGFAAVAQNTCEKISAVTECRILGGIFTFVCGSMENKTASLLEFVLDCASSQVSRSGDSKRSKNYLISLPHSLIALLINFTTKHILYS